MLALLRGVPAPGPRATACCCLSLSKHRRWATYPDELDAAEPAAVVRAHGGIGALRVIR